MVKFKTILVIICLFFCVFTYGVFAEEEKSVLIDTFPVNFVASVGDTFPVNVAIGSEYSNTTFYYLFYGGLNDKTDAIKTKSKDYTSDIAVTDDNLNCTKLPTFTVDEIGNGYLRSNYAYIPSGNSAGQYSLYVSFFKPDCSHTNDLLSEPKIITVVEGNSIPSPTPTPLPTPSPIPTIIPTTTPQPQSTSTPVPTSTSSTNQSPPSLTATPTINPKKFGLLTPSLKPTITPTPSNSPIPTTSFLTTIQAGSNPPPEKTISTDTDNHFIKKLFTIKNLSICLAILIFIALLYLFFYRRWISKPNSSKRKPKPLLAKKKLLLFLLFLNSSLFFLSIQPVWATTDTITTSGNWVVPSGVTSITVEAWGGGGAGGGLSANKVAGRGGGGAGGQYAIKTISVSPGTTYPLVIGSGGVGSASSGASGNDTTFNTNVVVAKGGAGGQSYDSGTRLAGVGTTAGGVGSTIFAGGSGSNGATGSTAGGAGGGGAGSTGSGGNASGNTAGIGTSLSGGNGGAGRTSSGNGNSGGVYGGGGGAGTSTATNSSTDRNGGNGANGLIKITYTPNTSPSTPTLISPSNSAIGQSTTPTFQTVTTDSNGDNLQYELKICTDLAMTTNCQTFDQSSSNVGWSGQDIGTSAYSSGTTATYILQVGNSLAQNTTYYWKTRAKDYGGTNTWSSTQTTAYSFYTGIPLAYQVSIGTTTSTNSITDVVMEGMTITPGEGDYLIWFSGSASISAPYDYPNYYSIYIGTSQVASTERQILFETSMDAGSTFPIATHAYVSSVGTSTISVKWHSASSSYTLISHQRTLTVQKVDPDNISQATAVNNTTTTSTTDTQLNNMVLTIPSYGNYLAWFSSSVSNTRDGSSPNQNASFYVNGVKIEHTERQVTAEESFETNTPLTMASHGSLGNLSVGDTVEVRWRTSVGTATANNRILTLEKIYPDELITQVTGTADTTTTSTSDVQMDSMTIPAPSTGDYLIWFSGSIDSNTTSNQVVSLYVNNTKVDYSSRGLYTEASAPKTSSSVIIQAYVSNISIGQTIEVKWNTSAGTATAHERTLTIQKLVDDDTDYSPSTPTLISPSNSAIGQSTTPTFQTVTTDSNGDNLQYELKICTDLAMTTNCQTFDQSSSNVGWSGQDIGTSAYSSGTTATYILQVGNSLAQNSTYYWKTRAKDYGGTNTWSSTQTTAYSFTTNGPPILSQSTFRWRSDSNNSDWYDLNWSSRKKISINSGSSETGTNYQIKIKVGQGENSSDYDLHLGGLAKSDFSDLRFTASDGTTLLDYWQESITGTSPNQTATVWVEVSDSLSINQDIFIYYGNSSASSVSNIHNTFIWGDDFENSTWTYANLGLYNYSGSTQAVEAGEYSTSGPASSQPSAQIKENSVLKVFPDSYIVETKTKAVTKYGSPYIVTKFNSEIGKYQHQIDFQYDATKINKDSSSEGWSTLVNKYLGFTTTADTWYKFTVEVIDIGTTNILNNYIDDVFQVGVSDPSFSSTGIAFMSYDWDNEFHIHYDDFRVRKYTSTPPSIGTISDNESGTWLASENIGITGVSPNENIRLRFSIANTGGNSSSNFGLQVAPKGESSTCADVNGSNFIDVDTTIGTNLAVMTTSPNFTNQEATTNELTDSATTFVAGKMVESPSTQSNTITLVNGEFTEVEYNFQMTNNVGSTTPYCFRVIDGETPLNTYTNVAQLTTTYFESNSSPSSPYLPYVNNITAQSGQQSSVYGLIDHTPAFSAIFDDSNTSDTAAYYQLQVGNDDDWTTAEIWDSTKTAVSGTCSENSRCSDIIYGGTALVDGSTYYWRIKFWDNSGAEGDWSSTQQFSMNNSPLVSNVVVNGNSSITLTENSTTTISWTGTVTDSDGYQNLSSAIGKLYRSDLGSSCSSSNNNCYSDSECNFTECNGNTCLANCSADIYFFADPTDDGDYVDENWEGFIKVTDNYSEIGSTTSSSTLTDMNSLKAFSVGSSIVYGEVFAGSDTGSSNTVTTITNTGNTLINLEINGDYMCTNYPDCDGQSIEPEYQEYNLSSFTYGTGTTLSISPAVVNIGLSQPTVYPSNSFRNIYWGIGIPNSKEPGSYQGATTILVY